MAGLAQTAFLVFQATPARARVIPPWFGVLSDNRRSCGGRLLVESLPSPLSGDGLYERSAVGEKAFIARAQIVQPRFAIRCLNEAILRTFAIAHRPDLTSLTVAGQRLQFRLSECPLRRTL